MVFSPYLSKVGIVEYLENEIKEKSIRCIDCVIEIMTLEESLGDEITTPASVKKFDAINKSFKGKTEMQCQKIFNKLKEKEREEYNKMKERELKQAAIDSVGKKKDELEKSIEIITILKEEVISWTD
jgi:hypothetical protein